MRNHLLYKHPLIYSQKDKTAKDLGEKQSNLDTVIKARVCSEDKAKKITNCILNLICMDIPVISRLLAAAQKLVGHFNHSIIATEALKKKQEQIGDGDKFKKLIGTHLFSCLSIF